MRSLDETLMSALRPDLVDIDAKKYLKSILISKYDRDEGLLMMPVLGPAGTAPVITRVHAPVGVRVVDFEYSRSGAPPVFPAQADVGRNGTTTDKLLSSTLHFPAPMESNGVLVYGVRGQYHFVQPEGGRSTESQFPIDGHPYPSLVDTLGTLNPTTLDPNLNGGVNTWRADTVDARVLCGYNIIG